MKKAHLIQLRWAWWPWAMSAILYLHQLHWPYWVKDKNIYLGCAHSIVDMSGYTDLFKSLLKQVTVKVFDTFIFINTEPLTLLLSP